LRTILHEDPTSRVDAITKHDRNGGDEKNRHHESMSQGQSSGIGAQNLFFFFLFSRHRGEVPHRMIIKHAPLGVPAWSMLFVGGTGTDR